MKRIVIAPQAFKGSLTAAQVAASIARGVHRYDDDIETVELPVADGGEGTVDALVNALHGQLRSQAVSGPLNTPIEAFWGLLPDNRAVIEMAAASGLPLLDPTARDPLRATTFGTGQLMLAALNAGVREIVIGIGGSATNDGGGGALQALGLRLLDAAGEELPTGGAALARLEKIDSTNLDIRLRSTTLRVMCDVSNPLCGPQGATAIYGPQKGVTPDMVQRLDDALAKFASVVERDLGVDIRDVPGAGAAGGLGGGLLAVGGRLESGAQLILDLVDFEKNIATADLVITGEGRLDGQSIYGKTTVAVAQRARSAGVSVLAVVGGLGEGYEACYTEGITAVTPIVPGPMSLLEAQTQAETLIVDATERALRMRNLGRTMG